MSITIVGEGYNKVIIELPRHVPESMFLTEMDSKKGVVNRFNYCKILFCIEYDQTKVLSYHRASNSV